MTREEKSIVIEELKNKFSNCSNFYVADSSGLTVAEVNSLRRKCFEKDIELKVYKNTLVRKAMEAHGQDGRYTELYDALNGPTSLMFTSVANSPAKVLKDFRASNAKPALKAAYIDTAVFLGDDKIETLCNLKSKDELVGEIIGLLQSPIKNVIGALKSGGQTIGGLVKTLQERQGSVE